MKVLSLFDGISCARVACERAGIDVEAYYASEIDQYAIQVSQRNWPDIKQVGSVVGFDHNDLRGKEDRYCGVDLLIGGSPCQDLSIAGAKRKGLAGSRSGLFYEYMRVLNEVKPKYFILENVASMSSVDRDEITRTIGVEPIMIDAALVSAQNRKRYFWTNIPGVTQPQDQGINIIDVIRDQQREEVFIKVPLIQTRRGVKWDTSGKGYFSQQDRAYSWGGKFPTIPTARTITKMKYVDFYGKIRQMTYEDIEEMQGLPRGYTSSIVQKEKRGGVIGNAFNVDVVAHILKFIPK